VPTVGSLEGKHSSSHCASLSSVDFHKCCWLSFLHQKHWEAKYSGILFPPRSHLFWTKSSLPYSLPRRKRRRKRRRVQSWDHWQLDVTKVNWNNRFLCVYILNGTLVSAVLGFLQKEKLGSSVATGLTHTPTHAHTHTYVHTHTHSLTVMSRLCSGTDC